MSNQPGGYTGKILVADLTRGQTTEERPDEATLRKYIGGTGLAANYLYREVPPSVDCFDPENCLIFAAGPLSGTKVHGSSNITAAGKGPLTDGATATMGNGFFAAYLKLSGYDAIIVRGASRKPVYLYLHDGLCKIRDASHLLDKDTREVDEAIRRELGVSGRQVSVLSTGPAAEKLVRFAGIIIDGAHSCSHNGLGAVMGSKKLKAIAAARGKSNLAVREPEKIPALNQQMLEANIKERLGIRERLRIPALSGDLKNYWSTADVVSSYAAKGVLPVRNYTTSTVTDYSNLTAPKLQTHWEIVERNPCWACRMIHSNLVRVKDGPYAGYEGKEPEYSHIGALGANIGVTDPGTIVMLTDVIDRLGLELNEATWTISWLMECYEKGLLSTRDTGGIEMTWGNADAVKAMLEKIVKREGIGDILAEGMKHAAERLGEQAAACAVYTRKGTSPGSHDERADWMALLDIVVSNTGWREHRGHSKPSDWGLPPLKDPFSPEEVATTLARIRGAQQFFNSVGVCIFCTKASPGILVQMLSAVTGWDFTLAEALEVGKRTGNLLRAFNIRHGLTAEMETPTPRYGSTPVDGPVKGKGITPDWEYMQRRYYEEMGWDARTGKPLPEILRKLGLEYTIPDIWEEGKR